MRSSVSTSRVHVADLDPRLVHVFGQVLGHALGERRDQRAIALGGGRLALLDQVLDLLLDRPDLDRRIDQAGGADHLFGEDAAGLLHLPRARRRRDEDRLRPHRVPFVEAQRPVVDRADGRRKPYSASVILRRWSPRDMPLTWPHGDVALVDEQHRVLGQIFEQRRRRLARHAAGEEAAVILDAGAGAGGGDHLQVEVGALLQPLRLQQLALADQLLQPLGQLEPDRLGRLLERRPGRDIVRVGEDADRVEAGDLLAGQRIELDDLLHLVAEEGRRATRYPHSARGRSPGCRRARGNCRGRRRRRCACTGARPACGRSPTGRRSGPSSGRRSSPNRSRPSRCRRGTTPRRR